ncbi:hypothetical protein BCD67_04395 [Oscillatoriales cyanobacterium USR001]|nr:hypothetical protein BCD67_04395 [Oscillatoriales cyanobacterium USR001]
MQFLTVWQHDSKNPENANNLASICQWWASLNDKKVNWVERLIPQIGGMSEIHWQLQRFDEIFAIVSPEIRGTTLYWYKHDSPVEHNSIAQKLELDNLKQELYIYPQSEEGVVVRVSLHEIEYQTIELQNTEITFQEQQLMTLRDVKQQFEVKVYLTPENLNLLKEWLVDKVE